MEHPQGYVLLAGPAMLSRDCRAHAHNMLSPHATADTTRYDSGGTRKSFRGTRLCSPYDQCMLRAQCDARLLRALCPAHKQASFTYPHADGREVCPGKSGYK